MTLIKAQTGKVFRRLHDGMIFGSEIVLGVDFSTGTPREDLPEYYEQVYDPERPTPPPMSGNLVAIPDYWEAFFPDDKFTLNGFVCELIRTPDNVLAVDIAYLTWQAFQQELDKPENGAIKRHMQHIWDYILTQIENENYL